MEEPEHAYEEVAFEGTGEGEMGETPAEGTDAHEMAPDGAEGGSGADEVGETATGGPDAATMDAEAVDVDAGDYGSAAGTAVEAMKVEEVAEGEAPFVRRGGWMTKCQRLAAAVVNEQWDEARRLAADYHKQFKAVG